MYPLTTAEDDPDREHERVSRLEALRPCGRDANTSPTGGGGDGGSGAQAWKGQQIAKGWRKLVERTTQTGRGRGDG